MKQTLLQVTKWTLVLTAIFFGVQVFFALLNKQSTVANIIGMLGIVYIITFVVFHTVNFIKKQLKNED
jgi:uncharacterized membrane protein